MINTRFNRLDTYQKTEVLILLKKALFKYKIGRFFFKSLLNVNAGFCHYFDKNRPWYSITMYQLLIICYKEKHGDYPCTMYWYEPGKCTPRIELLKMAIEKVERGLDE